jgi:hypothetical protein
MASNKGTATLDFGAAPGSQDASLAITGEATITGTSYVEVWMMDDNTADHSAYAHRTVLAHEISLVAGDVVNGTGFTIYATSNLTITGTVKVRWVWSS